MRTAKICAVLGLVCLFVGCGLMNVGLATTSWETRIVPLQVEGNVTDIVWTRGLWEECLVPVTETGRVPCRMQPLPTTIPATRWVLRVAIVLGAFLALVACVMTVVWLCADRCQESYGCRTCVFTFSSLATLIPLMSTLAYGMMIVIQKDAKFTLGWSFGVCMAGTLLLGPANFMLCHYAHKVDDRDKEEEWEKHVATRDFGNFQNNRGSSYM